MKQLFYILILICVYSCSYEEKYCDYYPAEYVKIKIEKIEKNNDEYNIHIEFDKTKLALKPQKLNDFIDAKLDDEFLKRGNLKEGKYLTGYVSEIKEGDCTPYVISFEQKLNP